MSLLARFYSLKGLLFGLNERDVSPDPIEQFQRWFDKSSSLGLPLANAFILATATRDGQPGARTLLLKDVDENGFVFYTNYNSRKGGELAENPRAAMVFHWAELFRQVRVEGRVEKTSEEESNAYFQSRPRGSRIGAWASKQSSVLERREDLEAQVREIQRKYRGQEVPLPPFWGGYLLVPSRIEFWQGRPSRLHDRICYERETGGWKMSRLSP